MKDIKKKDFDYRELEKLKDLTELERIILDLHYDKKMCNADISDALAVDERYVRFVVVQSWKHEDIAKQFYQSYEPVDFIDGF